MMIVKIVCYILYAIVFLYGLYFALTGLFTFLKSKKRIVEHDPKTNFAILIAARNEQEVIADLVTSLNRQNYPAELYSIYCLINNCTDNTEMVARNAGANIISVDIPVKGKGDVLKYAFEYLKDRKYDAYIIFDADNEVHPDFLKKMNDAYMSGYHVAQGRKDSKNLEDNWISASYSLFYYYQNIFFNKSRMNIGKSAAINGTGFMVKREIVEDDFNPQTITEDNEFSVICALNGIQIAYVDDAITYDEQPIDFKTSWFQRIRWSRGLIQCRKLYGKQLIKKAFKGHDMVCLDKYLFIIAPYVQVLSLILFAAMLFVNLVGTDARQLISETAIYECIGGAISFLIGAAVNAFAIAYYKRNIFKAMHGIFLFGLFMTTWIAVNIVSFTKKNLTWVPIKHIKKSNIHNILNNG